VRLDQATVLVVDDEIPLLKVFAVWLERAGCRALTAANGAEGLKVLETERVDALICDLRMPVMDGLTLVRRLHAMQTQTPVILFVSGFCTVDRREIHGLGVEALIEKPLRRNDLMTALERSLMEREEMWLTPMDDEVEQGARVEFAGLEEALRRGEFALGRGGCCVAYVGDLEVGKTLELSVRFAGDGLAIEAQGDVRWYDAAEGRGGVEFRYLEPACRGWVTQRMREATPRSYIPSG
jgi:CheY-like chemotaxis protein